MWIYCVSSGSDSRKRVIRVVILIVCAPVLLWILLPLITGRADGMLTALAEQASVPGLLAFPVAGWIAALVRGVLMGDMALILVGTALTVGFLISFIWIILRMRADYYEDVLLSTETTHSAIIAAKEGRFAETGRREVKAGKTGDLRGRGASVFFFKHLRESRRAGRLFFETQSLLFMAIPIAIAFFIGPGGFLSFLMASAFLMFFSLASARWVREFTRPYIYLVPQKPFIKLVMLCGESMLKCLLESVIIMVAAGLLTAASIPEIGLGILIRLGLGLFFIAMSALSERLFGGLSMKGLQVVLYLFSMVVLLAPGILLSWVLMAWLYAPLTVALGALILWGYGVSFLVIFLCRNMLTWAELNY